MPVILRKVVLGHPRTFVALAVTVVAYLMLPASLVTRTRAIMAWDAGVLGFLTLTLHLFLTRRAEHMPALAEAQEEGQWTIFWVTLLGSVASFVALRYEFSGLKDLPGDQRELRVALVSATLVLSWLLAHTVFALRYAHHWYDRDEDGRLKQGLAFPGEDEPDYMDFLYFSMVLGTTFQVSDVQITARRLRRFALLHGVVSFLYNTVIVAVTVNIAAGLL